MTQTTDVLIVGAGPVGLTLACDLRRRGIDHVVIEASTEPFAGSRAKGIQPRTQEVFDDLGVLEQIQGHAMPYPPLGIHLGPVAVPVAMARRRPPTTEIPHPNTLMIAQHDTVACLIERLEVLGGAVQMGERLTALAHEEHRVIASTQRSGGARKISARYVIGTDGASSVVRRSAGIRFVGSTDETDRIIIADVDVDGLPRNRWHIFPGRGGRGLALCPLPDGRRFQLMARLAPEDPLDAGAASITAIAERWSGRACVRVTEVHWSSVFRPNVRLASRYRAGPILIAGDAAHVHTPAGAQGLNTGVQDAYNLGWKLGQVLAGAPEALLDTYETERRPVAARVLGRSSELYRGMAKSPRLSALKRGAEERQLLITYRGGPLDFGSTPNAPVHSGDRIPDALLTTNDGRSRRLHELLEGPSFTLVTIGDVAADTAAWPKLGAQLNHVHTDAAPELLEQYGLAGPSAILIRPDGHLAATASTDELAATFERAAAELAPTSGADH